MTAPGHRTDGPLPRRLFLTGPSGCGKSTLLRHGLGDRIGAAGGFVTERHRDADGRYQYFYLQRADGGGQQAIFLDLRQTPPVRNDGVFTTTAVQLLQQPAPFFLLDEIGGMELLLPAFHAALEVFLASDIPCIGVLKGLKNAQALTRTASLPQACLQAAEQLHRQLSEDENTLLLEISHRDDPRAAALIRQWAEEYAYG